METYWSHHIKSGVGKFIKFENAYYRMETALVH